jgi:hypothetical protein
VPLPLDVVIKDPETGKPWSSGSRPGRPVHRPGYSGRVQTKLTVTLNFESDEGDLLIFER